MIGPCARSRENDTFLLCRTQAMKRISCLFFTHEIMPREGMRSTKGFRDFISFNSLLLFHSVVSFSKKAPPPPSDMKYEVSCINADPISQKLFFTNNCEVPVLLFGVFIETLHNGGEEVYKSVFLHMKYLFSLTYDLFL